MRDKKKITSVLLILLVFLVTIGGSIAIIYFFKPDNESSLTNNQDFSPEEMYSSVESDNVIGRDEYSLGTYLGEVNSAEEPVINGEPGDKTDIYDSAVVNYQKNGNGEYIAVWAQIRDDSIPLPRGILIGDTYSDILKKYPVSDAQDNAYKPFKEDAPSLQYKQIYGEYQVSSSYAVEVWDMNNTESTTPIQLIYADEETSIIYHIELGRLVVVEYIG